MGMHPFVGDVERVAGMSGGRWLLGLAPLPFGGFCMGATVQIVRGTGRGTIAWSIFAVVVTVALAGFVLRHYGSHAELALQPGEQYSTSGWYMIGLWGTYITGLAMLIISAGRLAFRLFRPRVSPVA